MAPTKTTNKKTATKKKVVKKALPKSRLRWRVSWLRTTNSEEFVTLLTSDKEGYYLESPTVITYISNRLILVPYGLLAKERSFFIPHHVIMHENEVSKSVHELYLRSLEATTGYVEKNFEDLLESSIKVVEDTLSEREKSLKEPTAEDLKSIEDEVLSVIQGVADEYFPPARSKTQVVDDLVKLADKKGKGKKKPDVETGD